VRGWWFGFGQISRPEFLGTKIGMS